MLFYFISPFFSPFYFVFSFIFSNANSFPHFYIRSTFKYILAHGDEYTTTTLHTFHDSWESESQQHIILFTTHTTHNDSRLTELGIQYCMRLIRLTKPEIQYDSRLTTLVLISSHHFCLAFFRLSISFLISIVKYILVSTFLYHLYPNSFSYTNRSAFHLFNFHHISMLSLYFAFLISPCHFHFLFDLFISSFNFHPFWIPLFNFTLLFPPFSHIFYFYFQKRIHFHLSISFSYSNIFSMALTWMSIPSSNTA